MRLLSGKHAARAGAPLVAFAVFAAGCSGTAEESTTRQPQPTTTAAVTVATTTTQVEPTTTTRAPDLTFAFQQVTADTDDYVYDIAYPLLVHPEQTITEAVNREIEAWVESAIDVVSTAEVTGKASYRAQIAPELVNSGVFSVSGVSTGFVSDSAGTVSERIAWIFSMADGSLVPASQLMSDGDLTALAEAAAAHLVDDVFGDDGAITSPDGLLPDPANFDAVWLTATGVGVGFDQFQVAAGSAGTPSVVVPFAELKGSLNIEGVLAPLATETELPAGGA